MSTVPTDLEKGVGFIGQNKKGKLKICEKRNYVIVINEQVLRYT